MGSALAERPAASDCSDHRLAFMIYPDKPAASRIRRLQEDVRSGRGLRGRLTALERLHISLNGLGRYGSRPDELIVRARRAASRVRMLSFVVGLNTLMSWSGDLRPWVIAGDEGDYGVRWLHEQLHWALVEEGLAAGEAPSFRPHLTLLRDRHETPEDMVPMVEWWVREFRLIDSYHGFGHHEQLGVWPLG